MESGEGKLGRLKDHSQFITFIVLLTSISIILFGFNKYSNDSSNTWVAYSYIGCGFALFVWALVRKHNFFATTLVLFISFAMLLASLSLLREEWRINNQFIPTSCTILYMHMNKSVIINNGSKQTLFVPSFYVTYKAANETITEWTGLSPINAAKAYSLEQWSDQYKVDESYPCWYNPTNNKEVALEKGYSWSAILFVMISLYLFISFLYMTAKAMRKDRKMA